MESIIITIVFITIAVITALMVSLKNASKKPKAGGSNSPSDVIGGGKKPDKLEDKNK